MQETALLPAAKLDVLIQALRDRGYSVIAPVKDEHAIVYDQITAAKDLPRGWIEEQEKGHYRLQQVAEPRYFGYTAAANAWKKFLNPPRRLLWKASRIDGKIQFEPLDEQAPPLAFVGVRSCDLHAIHIQDAVYGQGEYRDTVYCDRRSTLFTVAVNCTRAAATCFCTSMNTGPEVSLPSDITMTEVIDGDQHYFLVSSATDAGRQLLDSLPLQASSEQHRDRARTAINQAAQQMKTGPRHFDSRDHKELLYRNLESPAWDDVAQRCLSCANCTLACPTCFCSAVEDTTDLSGEHAERWQRWDSCFNADFSYIHGGSIRHSTRLRYRQWLTHKLASWIDQFGHSGCVGCGRCISWCPVGIDLTEQVLAIREAESLCKP